MKLWDTRKVGKGAAPLHSLAHGKSCQGAYFAPAGPVRVLTTSYDDTLRVWSGLGGGDKAQALAVKHNNQTGRWVSPFRAVWAPAGDAFVVGSLKRGTEVYNAGSGALMAAHLSEMATAIPPRHACHPCLQAIAAGTGSGRLHIWLGAGALA